MNLLLSDCSNAETITILAKLPKLKHVNVVFGSRSNDILIAHSILDSRNTIFIANTIKSITCADLIARALLSTTGGALSHSATIMDKIMPTYANHGPRMLHPMVSSINKGPGTGNWRAGVILLVGERPGKKASLGLIDAAFFSVEASSAWLREIICSMPYTAEDFYWVNAFDRNGIETNWSFIEKLKPIQIFAFGKYASVSLHKGSVPHIPMPHPQYWKRFKAGSEYPLITYIKGIK